MVAASLIGLYFHAELAAYVTRYSGEQDNVRIGAVGVEAVKQETPVPGQDAQKADSLARDPALPQQASRPGQLTGTAGYCAGQARCGGNAAGNATAFGKGAAPRRGPGK